MAKKKQKHIGYYLSLLFILGVGFAAMAVSYPNRKMELSILILTAFFYTIWGILHHHVNHSLSAKIVIEYVLVGSLGIAAILFFIMGAFGI